MKSDLGQRDRRKKMAGEERSGLPGLGEGPGAQGQDRQVSESSPLLPGSAQEFKSVVCQGKQVVAWRHSKGNGFLESC